ncbi:unnamed protein product [Tenebrio molitor]|nr:unnamed protein product [Tenebrio molitor]
MGVRNSSEISVVYHEGLMQLTENAGPMRNMTEIKTLTKNKQVLIDVNTWRKEEKKQFHVSCTCEEGDSLTSDRRAKPANPLEVPRRENGRIPERGRKINLMVIISSNGSWIPHRTSAVLTKVCNMCH